MQIFDWTINIIDTVSDCITCNVIISQLNINNLLLSMHSTPDKKIISHNSWYGNQNHDVKQ